MKDDIQLSDKKIEKLAKRLAKTFTLTQEEALDVIYKEWDVVEVLFREYKKVKEVHHYLVDEIGYTYRIA